MSNSIRPFVLLFALVCVATTFASANAIATLANSTTGSVKFVNVNGDMSDVAFSFTGNCGEGGSNCVAGKGLFEGTLGNYKLWMTGGPPTLNPPSGGSYGINMNGATAHFLIVLSDGSTLGGTIVYQELIGGGSQGPQFEGLFTASTVTGDFVGSYSVGKSTFTDMTINLPKNTSVDKVFDSTTAGFSSKGPVSSGEIVPVPESGSMVLLGTGLLGVMGFLRRHFQA